MSCHFNKLIYFGDVKLLFGFNTFFRVLEVNYIVGKYQLIKDYALWIQKSASIHFLSVGVTNIKFILCISN